MDWDWIDIILSIKVLIMMLTAIEFACATVAMILVRPPWMDNANPAKARYLWHVAAGTCATISFTIIHSIELVAAQDSVALHGIIGRILMWVMATLLLLGIFDRYQIVTNCLTRGRAWCSRHLTRRVS